MDSRGDPGDSPFSLSIGDTMNPTNPDTITSYGRKSFISRLFMLVAAIGTIHSLTVPEFDLWMLLFHLLLFAYAMSGLALATIEELKERFRVGGSIDHTVLMAATPEEIAELQAKCKSGDLVGAANYEIELFNKYSGK